MLPAAWLKACCETKIDKLNSFKASLDLDPQGCAKIDVIIADLTNSKNLILIGEIATPKSRLWTKTLTMVAHAEYIKLKVEASHILKRFKKARKTYDLFLTFVNVTVKVSLTSGAYTCRHSRSG